MLAPPSQSLNELGNHMGGGLRMDKPTSSSQPHEPRNPAAESKPMVPGGPAARLPEDPELRFRILNAEYSHVTSMLTSTLSITAARANLYFVAVSAAGVALALLANASHGGAVFSWLALPVLLLVLVMGVVALDRLLHANHEATLYLQSLNRIRHFFVEIDPGSSPYMALPTSDDEVGLFGSRIRRSSFGAMTQMPAASMATLVALIDAFVTGAIAGVVVLLLTGGQFEAVIAAGIALALGLAGFEGWAYLDLRRLRRSLDVRFPTTRHG